MIGFFPWDIKVDRQTLIISGQSADLLIYAHLDTGYAPHKASPSRKPVSRVYSCSRPGKADFWRGSEVAEYSKVNGSYLETDRTDRMEGVLVSAIKGDSVMDYVILLGASLLWQPLSLVGLKCSHPFLLSI